MASLLRGIHVGCFFYVGIGLGVPTDHLGTQEVGESTTAPSKSHDHRVRGRTSDRHEQ